MNIKLVKELKKELAKNIIDLIEKFENKTGLSVIGVDVKPHFIVSGPGQKIFTHEGIEIETTLL
jgi:hypothetical protein